MSKSLIDRRTIVSAMFEDDSADGLVRLIEHGDRIEVSIKAKSKIDGVTRVLAATLNQAMADVLADELRFWVNRQPSALWPGCMTAPAPSAGAEPREEQG